jgi:CspA family cold shock protein
MVEGTVKFFNRMRNYGFINGDDGKTYFVHGTGLKEGVEIDEGDRVSFEVIEGDKGPKAEKVEKIEKKKD